MKIKNKILKMKKALESSGKRPNTLFISEDQLKDLDNELNPTEDKIIRECLGTLKPGDKIFGLVIKLVPGVGIEVSS